MTNTRILLFAVLTLYSSVLLFIEAKTSQDFVRNFFTDIEGPIPFYAINTSLSVFLFWATAVVFAVCLLCIDTTKMKREKLFYISQIFMFFWLGFDDRFMVHEYLSQWTRESYIMLGLGIVEAYFLIALGQLRQQPRSVLFYLIAGAFWTGSMTLADHLFPSKMLFRLSIEDLSKSWGAFCLFFFGWEILRYRIQALKIQQL